MKRILLGTFSLLLAFTLCAQQFNINKKEIKAVMQRVADWQIAHQPEVKHQPVGWENAAMYMGMIDWAEIAEKEDSNQTYYKFLNDICRRAGWQPAKRMYHADDICVSQVYIDFYRKYKQPVMMWGTLARAQWVMANPPENSMQLDYRTGKGLDKWTWCDALFMAPPVYAKLYMETRDVKYIDFMHREFMESYNHLYDKEEHLFYRDWRYIEPREKNGRKIFWGRGNGWVLAGLCEILKELPTYDNHREFYVNLYKDMCHKIIACQQADGYWRASLLDPESYPSPETSSTGFIVYALAYGINQGILPETYKSIVEKGWKALVEAVEKDGKLGFVQPIGADPREVTRQMTEVYGVGAFLMAGSEIYKTAK